MNHPDTLEAGNLKTSTLEVRLWKELGVLTVAALIVCAALLWLSGCNNAPKSDQEIKDQAAQTTQQVKQDAQEAAANAKVAAAKAERKVDDIAAGVKEGLNSDKPAPGRAVSPGRTESIDINSASAGRLTTLPGISAARAQHIVDGRPYSSPHDLVDKGLISEAEYQRISDKVVAD
jgi:DNA uptake protein ComE-like DNA-binding protein